ncbi:MAG: OsmC family protein [Nitrosomonadaceae bacterium]|nr:OsmC family protein [Nitrosospira sp.]MDW7564683.1 OsmC family protein [Nitrosomonadaceae bacterium]MBI0410201.1 OsmC family protein [Nitrosospira sp.]MBI0412040.1 OsmC family protein [Nitrosospira sp.]MBI0421133.1 OsmC family protein [Nitrosospira sp.]
MKARIEWKDGMSFLGESGSGHQVLMDGPPETGGRNLGPRPMEMLLMGTGGCAAFDVMLILKKGRQEISDCVVEIEAQRATNEPKVFTHIHFHFILTGKNLQPQQIERAISLSAEKYCSASIMLGKTAEMTHDFEIVEG